MNVIKIEGRSYPFGGVCNKYYNAAHHLDIDPRPFDYVARRQAAVFGKDDAKDTADSCATAGLPSSARSGPLGGADSSSIGAAKPREVCCGSSGASASRSAPATRPFGTCKSVGLTRSFFVNTLYPLYRRFFDELGLDVITAETVDEEGIARTYSSFCYPAEIAHGMLMDLAKKKPDYIFMPRVYEMRVENPQSVEPGHQCTCITAFGEAYYLKSAFKDVQTEVIEPLLNFSKGWDSQEEEFVRIGRQLGCGEDESRRAYRAGVSDLQDFLTLRKRLGREALAEIERDPNVVGVVLFGRPYNAFADEANMGIPRKFASRGVHVIPFDFLPFENEPNLENMTWAMGQDILRAAHFVKKHPQLFGAYVTNFGCGPDSFVVGYFRDIMKTKPSLTLEIDSHTADAGVNTRVEAFLDIVDRYRKLGVADAVEQPLKRAELAFRRGRARYLASDGTEHDLSDPRVKVVFPSMGRTLTELASAAFRGFGIRSEAVPYPSHRTLMAGRANTCCKECLPLILTVGSLLEYVEDRREPDELLLYFMPTSNGNCRFPQYYVYLNKLIEKHRLENVVTYTLSSENSYGGLGPLRVLTMVKAIIVGDVMDDIRNAMLVLAEDREQALAVFDEVWRDICDCFAAGTKGLAKVLARAAARLAEVPKRFPINQAKKVLMAGEIYVRKDEFSSQRVVNALARKDIVVQRAPMIEWIHYVDYWVQYVERRRLALGEWIEMKTRMFVMNRAERKIKKILARSGFYQYEVCDIGSVLDVGEQFVDRYFGGETILVIGRFFKDIMKDFHGMISIGPFACLPTRIIEAILTPESKIKGNGRIEGLPGMEHLKAVTSLPFLSIESDGNPFPQIIEAQMEAFSLQVERLFQRQRGLLPPTAGRFSLEPVR